MLAPVRTSVPATTNGSSNALSSLPPTLSAAAVGSSREIAEQHQELVAALPCEHVGVAQNAA